MLRKLKTLADAVPNSTIDLKKSAKATKDPLSVILAGALGDDGGSLRGAHRFQLWAETQPMMKASCQQEMEGMSLGSAGEKNGFRSHYWATEFAKEPEDVRDSFTEQAAQAVKEAQAARDALYAKTEGPLPLDEAQK